MRKLLFAWVLGLAANPFHMSDTDAAAADGPTGLVPPGSTTPVEVPVEHVSLLKRLLSLLEKDATWVKDNVEGGLTMLEGMFKEKQITEPSSAGDPAEPKAD
jgi:hypothetical protein